MAMMAVGDTNVPSLSTVGKFEFQSWQGRLKVFTTYANTVLVLKIQNYYFTSSKVNSVIYPLNKYILLDLVCYHFTW